MDWRDVTDPAAEHPFGASEVTRYERGAELGWGGMGRVLAAHDRRLDRQVALKEVVATAAHGSQASSRLAREAAITARLDHPSIVPVFDAGVSADGELYYTMRLIRGRTLAAAIGEAADLPARLGLLRHFLDVCEAMAFAHSLGVVHRDLKPDNIMVGEFGETQVMDWGLARADEEDEEADGPAPAFPGDTQAGAVLGTPRYMSPEQARGERADLRSDVWSLGMVLWELLCGVPPLSEADSATVLEAVALGRVPPIATRCPDAPPELVAIAEHALQSSAADRYPSARELAQDVTRYLDGALVAAHSYTPREHLLRWVRAYRAPLTVALLGSLLLAGLAGVAYQRNLTERRRAEAAEGEASEALDLADQRLGRSLAAHAARAWSQGAWPEAEVLAAHSLAYGENPEARGVLAGVASVPLASSVDSAEAPPCTAPRLSDDGALALCSEDGQLSLWARGESAARWTVPGWARWASLDLDAGLVHHTWIGGVGQRSLADGGLLTSGRRRHDGGLVLAAARTPDGLIALADTRLVRTFGPAGEQSRVQPCANDEASAALGTDRGFMIACGNEDLLHIDWLGTPLQRWRSTTEAADGWVASIDLDAVNQRLALGTEAGVVAVLDMTTDAITHRIQTDDDPVQRVRWMDDGRVAVGTERGGVRMWTPAAGVWVERFPRAKAGAFASRGQTLVTLGDRWTEWAFDSSGRVPAVATSEGLTTSRIAPDGRALVTLNGSGSLDVWELPSGRPLAARSWHVGVIKDGAFSRDGSQFFAASVHSGLRLFDTLAWIAQDGPWDTIPSQRRVARYGDGFVTLRYSRDGVLAWTGADRRMEVVELDHGAAFHDSSATATGSGVAVLSESHAVRWMAPGSAPVVVPTDRAARAIATAHGQPWIALATEGGVVIIDRATGDERLQIGAEATLMDLQVSPNDRWLAAGTLDGRVLVWTLSDGERVLSLRAHNRRVASVEFEPTSAGLWTASWDGSARRIDLADIHAAPAALLTRSETRWDLTLDEALAAVSR